MTDAGEPRLEQVGDAGEFTAALRQLKERSGLTYRQLEERAAENGEVLARSTLADVLGGKTVPRSELVAAFVRACGDGARLPEWLRAGERAVSTGRSGGGAEPPTEHPRRRPRRRGVLVLSAGLGMLGLAAVVWAVASSAEPGGSGGARAGEPPSSQNRPVLPRGPVQLRPVLADGLCLTDGNVEGYEPLVAVQRPCGDVAPQETVLVPAGDSTYRVQWYHPDQGKGCLNAVTAPSGAALLEPWNDCEKTSRFRIEPTDTGRSDRYVLRVVGNGCVGISGSGTSSGTAAVIQACRKSENQVFDIRSQP
ncbi:helix-turn-helix domain-containing protein [Streptomyces sp. NPDC005931]|uniref:RICIN domain-containing protein n=1 Tax=Streptomyces sp. NPDC005931 TaxID=3364737 RepID=UPI0036CB4C39